MLAKEEEKRVLRSSEGDVDLLSPSKTKKKSKSSPKVSVEGRKKWFPKFLLNKSLKYY